jgi:hypothetical protein
LKVFNSIFKDKELNLIEQNRRKDAHMKKKVFLPIIDLLKACVIILVIPLVLVLMLILIGIGMSICALVNGFGLFSIVFIMVGLFFFLLAVPVFGSTIFEIIIQIIGDNTFTEVLYNILVLLKYPIIIFILYSNIRIMYIIAPDEEIPPKTIKKGSLFTTIGWILSTEIFAFYIETFARYNEFYRSISNVLILLIWVYLLSYIYVLGMIINASEFRKEVITE